MRLLDVASMMDHSLPDDASCDGIHFDSPRDMEWLNGDFQRHINLLESDMLETDHIPLVHPQYLPSSLLGPCPIVCEGEPTREEAQGAAVVGNKEPRRWKKTRRNPPHPRDR